MRQERRVCRKTDAPFLSPEVFGEEKNGSASLRYGRETEEYEIFRRGAI